MPYEKESHTMFSNFNHLRNAALVAIVSGMMAPHAFAGHGGGGGGFGGGAFGGGNRGGSQMSRPMQLRSAITEPLQNKLPVLQKGPLNHTTNKTNTNSGPTHSINNKLNQGTNKAGQLTNKINQGNSSVKSLPGVGGPQGTGKGPGFAKGEGSFMKKHFSGNNQVVNNHHVIPAKNGNTGVTGIGLPHPGNNMHPNHVPMGGPGQASNFQSHHHHHGVSPLILLSLYGSSYYGALPSGYNAGCYASCPTPVYTRVPVYTSVPSYGAIPVYDSGSPVVQTSATSDVADTAVVTNDAATTPNTATPDAATTAPADATPATGAPAVNATTTPVTLPGPSPSDEPEDRVVSAPAATQPVQQVAAVDPQAKVDLVLENVQMVDAHTEGSTPTYQVTVSNQGSEAAGKFRVGVFAEENGKLTNGSPRMILDVPSLGAGEVTQLTFRLTNGTIKLASTNAAKVPFSQLMVAVDVDNQLPERTKANNIAVLERAILEATAQ